MRDANGQPVRAAFIGDDLGQIFVTTELLATNPVWTLLTTTPDGAAVVDLAVPIAVPGSHDTLSDAIASIFVATSDHVYRLP